MTDHTAAAHSLLDWLTDRAEKLSDEGFPNGADGHRTWAAAVEALLAERAEVRIPPQAAVEPTEEERAAADRLMTAAQNGKISGEDLQMIFDARWVASSEPALAALRAVAAPFAAAYVKSLPHGSRGYGGCPWWQKVASDVAATHWEALAKALDPSVPGLDDQPRVAHEDAAEETDWRERAEAAEQIIRQIAFVARNGDVRSQFHEDADLRRYAPGIEKIAREIEPR